MARRRRSLAAELIDGIRRAAAEGDVAAPRNIKAVVNIGGEPGSAHAEARQHVVINQTTTRPKGSG